MNSKLFKQTYIYLFILLTVSFLALPLVTTFDHFLTRSINGVGNNNFVQNVIIPHEAKLIAVALKPLGFDVQKLMKVE